MSTCLLWPITRWADNHEFELEAAGSDVECIFCAGPESVTDEQWARADGLISIPDPLEGDDVQKLEKCRIIVTPKVGFDNFDLGKWGELGIPLCNVPDYGTQDVADHAMGLLLSLMKGISRYDHQLRTDPVKGWRAMDHPLALRLSHAKIGIVGLGRIGTAMTLRCKAFGMDVTFYDPYKSNGSELALGIKRVETLEALFAESDIITMHVPLSEETRDLINADVLSHAKPGLVLINAARGEVVDIDALHDSIKSGQVAGAGLDVLPEEPCNMERPLLKAWNSDEEWIRDRVLITPHSAFYTPQSVYDMRVKGIHVAKKYLATGRLENCVNEEFLTSRR
ncbi:MAG: C-terminal binding protein [bacterium]